MGLNTASNVFGFFLDLVAILCLFLLVVALKTIYQKVRQETQIVLNPSNQESAIEVILNTKQIRHHVVTIIIMALALTINFMVTIIGESSSKERAFNVSYYIHLVTWLM